MTMKAAQEMARIRWKDKTNEEKSQHAKMMSEERQKLTTPEQRSAAAKKAAQARWKDKKTAKKTVQKNIATKKGKPR